MTPGAAGSAREPRAGGAPRSRARVSLVTGVAVDVAIVGAGIAGCALAIALADLGLAVALIERRRAFVDRIRGDGLAPWGVAEAARLGLLDAFAAAGAYERRYWDTWDRGERRRRDELAELDPHARGVLTFRNHHVQAALLDQAASAGVRIVRGRTLRDARRARWGWEAHVGAEQLRAGLLVRADGRSGGRRAGVCVDPHTHSVTGTILRCPGLDETAVATARVAGGRLLLFPIGADLVRAYYMSTARLGRGCDRARMEELLLDELATALPHAARGARLAGALGSFTNACVWPARLSEASLGRVGDAAGTTDPSIGQGVALALRDARELRDLLAAGLPPQAALGEYARRRARYFAVQRMVAWASWVADRPGKLGAATRAALRASRSSRRATILRAVRTDPLAVNADRSTAAALVGLEHCNPDITTNADWLDFQAPLRAASNAHPERQENV